MAEDRQPKMRAMIMANDQTSRRDALTELLPLQQQDFEGLFDAMAGLPVTIRLLDPPLHEFLPNIAELSAQVERAKIEQSADLADLERVLARVQEISEENPMLGTRGCRLGILYPEIYEMQVQAILRAANNVAQPPHPEIMIPLVGYETELQIMRELVTSVGDQEGMKIGTDYTVGTMIELPERASLLTGSPSTRTSSASAPTTSPKQRSGSLATTLNPRSCRSTSNARSSTAARSKRSTHPASAGSSDSPPGSDAKHDRTSNSGSAANTEATRPRFSSSTRPGSTTSPAAPTEYRSPASPPPRPRSARHADRCSWGSISSRWMRSDNQLQVAVCDLCGAEPAAGRNHCGSWLTMPSRARSASSRSANWNSPSRLPRAKISPRRPSNSLRWRRTCCH